MSNYVLAEVDAAGTTRTRTYYGNELNRAIRELVAWRTANTDQRGYVTAHVYDDDDPERGFFDEEDTLCECPCHHGRGADGYSHVWDDERGVRHEDWVVCGCDSPNPAVCRHEAPTYG